MRRLRFLSALIVFAAAPATAAGVLAPGEPLTEDFLAVLVDQALVHEADGRLRIEIDQPPMPLGNRSAAPTTIAVRGVERDGRSGRFRGLVRGSTEDGGSFTLPLAGRAVAIVDVPVPARRIERGELVTAADVDWRGLAVNRLPRGAILDPDRVVGGEARRHLAPGRVVTERDIGPPLLVRRGRPVRLTFRRDGLTITALGTAQDDGARGALVRVTNTDSRRQVQGLVTGPDQVMVGAAAPPAVE